MDSFEINKIIAAIILVVAITIGVSKVSDSVFHVNKPEKPGYKVELVSASTSSSASKDEKIGLAIGVTENLTKKYDAVKLAKTGSEIIGGKGGGGRPDFAQAGGADKSKIDTAFEKIKSLI